MMSHQCFDKDDLPPPLAGMPLPLFANALLQADQVAENAKAAAELAPTLGMRGLDAAPTRQGMSRSQCRELLNQIKDGGSTAIADAARGSLKQNFDNAICPSISRFPNAPRATDASPA